MKKAGIIVCGVITLTLLPLVALARIGVGIGTGKITVDQPLKPGLIYTLPVLSVLNTGDEPGNYGVSIEYHEGQEFNPEMGFKPEKEWFQFEPENFILEPGQVQQVQIKLSLPVKDIEPGNYFAYLEGHPVKKDGAGNTSVGVAAATKLYFTVVPVNFISGIYYRIISIFKIYSPWSFILTALVGVVILITMFRHFFSFNIGISVKKKENNE